jgi:hypothetical protein
LREKFGAVSGNFAGIYRNMRRLLVAEVGRLRFRCNKTKDLTLGAKLDHLSGKLAKLPERWEFSAGQGNHMIELKRRSVQSYGSASTSYLPNPFVRPDK